MTRAAVFLNRFFYKVWFFGACYYWGTWLFLAVSTHYVELSPVHLFHSLVHQCMLLLNVVTGQGHFSLQLVGLLVIVIMGTYKMLFSQNASACAPVLK